MDKNNLFEVSSPEHVAVILRRVAQRYREDAEDLDAAWQDNAAGKPWRIIAKELEKTADKLEKTPEVR